MSRLPESPENRWQVSGLTGQMDILLGNLLRILLDISNSWHCQWQMDLLNCGDFSHWHIRGSDLQVSEKFVIFRCQMSGLTDGSVKFCRFLTICLDIPPAKSQCCLYGSTINGGQTQLCRNGLPWNISVRWLADQWITKLCWNSLPVALRALSTS